MAFVLAERRFRAMNTDVAAWLWAEPGPADIWLPEIESFFGEVEAELSRFRPDSGLSRLNAAAGQGPQSVSPMLASVLALALRYRDSTGGIFDPAVLPALQAAGYDRSFETLQAAPAPPSIQDAKSHQASCSFVSLVLSGNRVDLPAGVQIDLGGIAKGWTVDRAAELLGAWGAALVDAGGDIRASAAPGRKPWPVAVEDPFHPGQDLAVAELTNGAIATSSVLRRSWVRDGRQMHHLIDPRTGRPSQSELVSVTVLAPTTVQAEVSAKVALILGREDGRDFIEKSGLDALFVDRDGQTQVIGREAFEVAARGRRRRGSNYGSDKQECERHTGGRSLERRARGPGHDRAGRRRIHSRRGRGRQGRRDAVILVPEPVGRPGGLRPALGVGGLGPAAQRPARGTPPAARALRRAPVPQQRGARLRVLPCARAARRPVHQLPAVGHPGPVRRNLQARPGRAWARSRSGSPCS